MKTLIILLSTAFTAFNINIAHSAEAKCDLKEHRAQVETLNNIERDYGLTKNTLAVLACTESQMGTNLGKRGNIFQLNNRARKAAKCKGKPKGFYQEGVCAAKLIVLYGQTARLNVKDSIMYAKGAHILGPAGIRDALYALNNNKFNRGDTRSHLCNNIPNSKSCRNKSPAELVRLWMDYNLNHIKTISDTAN